jgi:hypothetical protein
LETPGFPAGAIMQETATASRPMAGRHGSLPSLLGLLVTACANQAAPLVDIPSDGRIASSDGGFDAGPCDASAPIIDCAIEGGIPVVLSTAPECQPQPIGLYQPFIWQLAAACGELPYEWVSTSALPSGVTFESGTIEGKPGAVPQPNPFPFTVTVIDRQGVKSLPKQLWLLVYDGVCNAGGRCRKDGGH